MVLLPGEDEEQSADGEQHGNGVVARKPKAAAEPPRGVAPSRALQRRLLPSADGDDSRRKAQDLSASKRETSIACGKPPGRHLAASQSWKSFVRTTSPQCVLS